MLKKGQVSQSSKISNDNTQISSSNETAATIANPSNPVVIQSVNSNSDSSKLSSLLQNGVQKFKSNSNPVQAVKKVH
jgi:hypothetical protein